MEIIQLCCLCPVWQATLIRFNWSHVVYRTFAFQIMLRNKNFLCSEILFSFPKAVFLPLQALSRGSYALLFHSLFFFRRWGCGWSVELEFNCSPLPLTTEMCGWSGEKSERIWIPASLCAVHLLTRTWLFWGVWKFLSLAYWDSFNLVKFVCVWGGSFQHNLLVC